MIYLQNISYYRLLITSDDTELALNHKAGFNYHHIKQVIPPDPDDKEQESNHDLSEGEGKVKDTTDNVDSKATVSIPSILTNTDTENMESNKFKKNTLNVTFAEDKNTSLDITPRERRLNRFRNVITRNRPKSSRSDLRYVRSRVDSGIKLTADKKSTGANEELDQNRNEPVEHSYGRSPSKDSLFSNASTVSVEYIEDSDQDSNTDDTKNRRKRISRTKSEVETMISQISLTDDEDESKKTDTGQRVNEAASLKTSNPNQNFFQIAMQAKKEDVKEVTKNKTIVEQKFKTTKTLEFSEGEVKETKDVSLIGTVVTELEPNEKPIPQRPVYPNKGRPPPLLHAKVRISDPQRSLSIRT